MFDALSERLNRVFRGLRGRGRITEENVSEVMREIRAALLEADVNLEVARSFCDEVKQKAIGAEVIKTLRPADVMVKIVHDELVRLMYPVGQHVDEVRCSQ
ncbi:MAG: signal recognition particle receptor subunit alpha [Phycisphaerae bacterium]